MWDFHFGRAIGMMVRTAPFVLLRLVVFVGIGIAYLIATGTGAGVGYGFARLSSPDAAGGAFLGGALGFGIVSVALYWAREYILYLVKAGHIAVLVELHDGHDVPAGQSQLGFGTNFVKTHFTESSVLFGVDQLIKGVLRALFGTVNFIASFLPIPGLRGLLDLAENVVRMSLTYVDEIILAYLIRTRTTNPWATARDGLILYAQNYKHFFKNALWLSVFLWLLTLVLFLVLLGPVAALVAFMPGSVTVFTFGVALVFALGLKAAVFEPIAIAALMEVYFKTIEGQVPNPEWEARLEQASGKFRDLAARASSWITPAGRAPQA
jgi:uncharacterized membrane protein